jgi:RNA polymerase sigma-19 factor, ECF subfamily
VLWSKPEIAQGTAGPLYPSRAGAAKTCTSFQLQVFAPKTLVWAEASMKRTPHTPLEAASTETQFAGNAYELYSDDLHRYLVRRVPHPQDADDLAQEVFLRLMRVEHSDRVRKPVAYLFSVAANLIREFRLRASREQAHVTFDSDIVEELGRNLGGSADALPDHLDMERQLLRALGRLPQTHRTVLLLVKRDGLSHREVAEATGLSLHTIERYVVEATARMAHMAWDR